MVRPGKGLSDLKETGFTHLMLDFGAFASVEGIEEESYRPDLMHRYYKGLLNEMDHHNMDVKVGRVPFLSPYTRRSDLSERILRMDIDCIRACEEIHCKNIIIQPLFSGVRSNSVWDENQNFYLELARQCQCEDTRILLVNQFKHVNGKPVRGICSEGEEAARWIDNLNETVGIERFGFCMDTGCCNLSGQDMQILATSLGQRLMAVVLTENNGRDNTCMMPFSCSYERRSNTDWTGLIRGLRQCGFDGQLILDIQDTFFAFSPFLRSHLLPLTKAVADYFVLQIELEKNLKKYSSRVLFGAGNMCRNYMKCYGEKYAPLFICDNNEQIWNKEFCGIEVKSPEALKNLPDDCGIIVCNMYYQEVKAQLQLLGVKNIEYFSDEYMPSFYYDKFNRDVTQK